MLSISGFLFFAVCFWVLMWGVTNWLDKRDLIRLLSSMTTCCRAHSVTDSTILEEFSSTTTSSSSETEEASWGKTVSTRLSDADDVQSETEESTNYPPPATWGPSTPAKLPTPAKPAVIFCEAGSHNNVYAAGFITLCQVLAVLCVKVNVAALPAGTVWGDVLGFAIIRVNTTAGKVCYELLPVEHYWADDCHPGLSTPQDIVKAFEEANNYW